MTLRTENSSLKGEIDMLLGQYREELKVAGTEDVAQVIKLIEFVELFESKLIEARIEGAKEITKVYGYDGDFIDLDEDEVKEKLQGYIDSKKGTK